MNYNGCVVNPVYLTFKDTCTCTWPPPDQILHFFYPWKDALSQGLIKNVSLWRNINSFLPLSHLGMLKRPCYHMMNIRLGSVFSFLSYISSDRRAFLHSSSHKLKKRNNEENFFIHMCWESEECCSSKVCFVKMLAKYLLLYLFIYSCVVYLLVYKTYGIESTVLQDYTTSLMMTSHDSHGLPFCYQLTLTKEIHYTL